MTDAYKDAEGVGHSKELELLRLVERLGATEVLGRQLYAREIFRGFIAENVYNAKIARDRSDDWAKWSQNNPKAAALLAKAEILVNG